MFTEKYAGKPGYDNVLQELGLGGSRGEGANWQIRYALQHLNPNDVVGFEQAGTKGRVDIILNQGGRIVFLDTKQINWYALEKLNVEGRKAEAIVTQLLEHAEGQNVFSKVVIEATDTIPAWFIEVIQEAGITVDVFTK